MKVLLTYPKIEYIGIFNSDARSEILQTDIFSAVTSKKLTENMVRVRSSNVWAYKINVKDRKNNFGDVYVQFKGPNGGPQDVYVYYDVPVKLYRQWVTAPSKGHFFWVHIRNNFKYSKLTGDKRGKLKNAVN